jgi:hypothetical protein
MQAWIHTAHSQMSWDKKPMANVARLHWPRRPGTPLPSVVAGFFALDRAGQVRGLKSLPYARMDFWEQNGYRNGDPWKVQSYDTD